MELKFLPKLISNFREIITGNFAFIDKTRFIETIESQRLKVPLFLRPRRFGKSLFTDILAQYYDINGISDFKPLFGNTYIGEHPTPKRNSFYILKFDFSGVNSDNLKENFYITVKASLMDFCSRYPSLDIRINEETRDAASLMILFFTSFKKSRPQNTDRIFVIIDEYDNFANDVLAVNNDQFREMTGADGFVKSFYARLKFAAKESDAAVGRFFITGVSSIMINSITSGFDSDNISQLPEYNEMIGFTENELRDLIRQTMDMDSSYKGLFTENELMSRLKLYFDGYAFSPIFKNHMFNSAMCINYLSRVKSLGQLTGDYEDEYVNMDIAKFSGLMNLIQPDDRERLSRIVAHADDSEEDIVCTLEKNLNINTGSEFTFRQGVSMLFYLGYLTYGVNDIGKTIFVVPNLGYLKMFLKYYVSLFFRKRTPVDSFGGISDMEENGNMTGFVKALGTVISGIIPDNEKDVTERSLVSIAGTLILSSLEHCRIITEYEIFHNGKRTDERADLVILNNRAEKPSFLIEFKYLREKAEHRDTTKRRNITKAKKAAKEQILRYLTDDTLKETPNLRKYLIVYAFGSLVCEEAGNQN